MSSEELVVKRSNLVLALEVSNEIRAPLLAMGVRFFVVSTPYSEDIPSMVPLPSAHIQQQASINNP